MTADRRTEELLEAGDVAKLAARSRSWVLDSADAGRLPLAAVTPRGVRLFRRVDVDAFLHPRRRTVRVT
jgi:hypothetical protein